MLKIKKTIDNQIFLQQIAQEIESVLNHSYNHFSFKVFVKPSNTILPNTYFFNILCFSKDFKDIPINSTWYNCHTCDFVYEKPDYADKLNFVKKKLTQQFSSYQ